MEGKIVGMRFASIDLPLPGGPISRILCPPEAAISKARLTWCWPLTSASWADWIIIVYIQLLVYKSFYEATVI